MKGGEHSHMKQKLHLTFALAVGVLGGSILSHSLVPTVFAQAKAPTLIPGPEQRMTLTTARGIKVAEFDPNQGTIKLFPIVGLRASRTEQTVTIELTAAK